MSRFPLAQLLFSFFHDRTFKQLSCIPSSVSAEQVIFGAAGSFTEPKCSLLS